MDRRQYQGYPADEDFGWKDEEVDKAWE